MMEASDFLKYCKQLGYSFFSGTPCSYLKPLINSAIDDPEISFYDATNEGDAVAMAAGAHVTGKKSVVMFQNSGLGNAVNALTSLCFPFRIPILILVTHRGAPNGPADEPQHELMGQITEQLLSLQQIKWAYFPDQLEQLPELFQNIETQLTEHKLPFALVLKKDSFSPYELKSKLKYKRQTFFPHLDLGQKSFHSTPQLTRAEVLGAYLQVAHKRDIVVTTTGYTSRELYTLRDASNHFYMVGSMGSASSFALGLSLCRPDRRTIVFDGDGALLMRMGNLASVGTFLPPHFHHVLLDNEAHDSTGGQSTVSGNISFTQVALSCGYKKVLWVEHLDHLKEHFLNSHEPGPFFIHVKITTGSLPNLGRPKITPYEVKERLMTNLQEVIL